MVTQQLPKHLSTSEQYYNWDNTTWLAGELLGGSLARLEPMPDGDLEILVGPEIRTPQRAPRRLPERRSVSLSRPRFPVTNSTNHSVLPLLPPSEHMCGEAFMMPEPGSWSFLYFQWHLGVVPQLPVARNYGGTLCASRHMAQKGGLRPKMTCASCR